MTGDSDKKNIFFQDLDPALAHALREHLGSFQINDISAAPGQPIDLIVAAGSTGGQQPGIATVHIAPQARLGAVLGDIARALDEPTFAVMPFALGEYTFYPAEKKLEHADGRETALTEREVILLLYLARRTPHAATREEILRDVWRYQDGIDTHTLETHIYRLRQKIEDSSAKAQILITTTEGYVLRGIASRTASSSD